MKNIKLVDLFLAFVAGCYVWVGGIAIQEYFGLQWGFWEWFKYIGCIALTLCSICVIVLIVLFCTFIKDLEEDENFGNRTWKYETPFKTV